MEGDCLGSGGRRWPRAAKPMRYEFDAAKCMINDSIVGRSAMTSGHAASDFRCDPGEAFDPDALSAVLLALLRSTIG